MKLLSSPTFPRLKEFNIEHPLLEPDDPAARSPHSGVAGVVSEMSDKLMKLHFE